MSNQIYFYKVSQAEVLGPPLGDAKFKTTLNVWVSAVHVGSVVLDKKFNKLRAFDYWLKKRFQGLLKKHPFVCILNREAFYSVRELVPSGKEVSFFVRSPLEKITSLENTINLYAEDALHSTITAQTYQGDCHLTLVLVLGFNVEDRSAILTGSIAWGVLENISAQQDPGMVPNPRITHYFVDSDPSGEVSIFYFASALCPN